MLDMNDSGDDPITLDDSLEAFVSFKTVLFE